MKYIVILFASFLSMTANSLFAQDQITDEELKKYVVMMDSIDDMKASLLKEIDAMVASNDQMKNTRYNELYLTKNDSTKLAEAKATEAEIAFMKKVADAKSEGTVEITNTFRSLAKDYVGASSYNKIKAALKTDKALESKYKAMLEELNKGEVN
jgi:hypothetical protein